jgi:hypothetical protein
VGLGWHGVVKGTGVLRDCGLWACVGVGYECEFVSVGVCGEGLDVSVCAA